MEIAVRENGVVAVVSIKGEIDSKTAPGAQEQLLPYVERHGRMVMELSELTFMSSAGLRMMLLLYRQATAKTGKLALVGLSERIKDTMQATGFLAFFVVCNSVEEATKAVQS